MGKVEIKVLFLLALFLACTSSGFTDNMSFILDKANVLSDSEKDELNKVLSDYERQSSVELVGMIVDSLQGEDILSYSSRVFTDLKIGKRNVNNGGLILIAIKEKRLRISLGYGLEWPVSDLKASLIIEEMIPFLKKGNYFEGLEIGFNRLIEMSSEYNWTIEDKILELLQETDVGKIFTFKAIFLREIRDKAKTNADGSFEIRPSPYNQIIVKVDGQGEVIINTTEHMSVRSGFTDFSTFHKYNIARCLF